MPAILVVPHRRVEPLLERCHGLFLLGQRSLGVVATPALNETRRCGLLVHALDVLASQHRGDGFPHEALLTNVLRLATSGAGTLLLGSLGLHHGLRRQHHLRAVDLRERHHVLVVLVRGHCFEVFVRSSQRILLVLLSGVHFIQVESGLRSALLVCLASHVELSLQAVDVRQPCALRVWRRTTLSSEALSHLQLALLVPFEPKLCGIAHVRSFLARFHIVHQTNDFRLVVLTCLVGVLAVRDRTYLRAVGGHSTLAHSSGVMLRHTLSGAERAVRLRVGERVCLSRY